MFGTREEFDYFQCGSCETLQIAEIPELTRFYPSNYYSLENDSTPEVEKYLRRRLSAPYIGKYVVEGKGRLGRYLDKKRPLLRTHLPESLLDPILNVSLSTRILDIGCGRGDLLRTLHWFGFRNLTGADPFIDESFRIHRHVRILKSRIEDITGKYEVVMLHHSLEHLSDPKDSLVRLADLLAENAKLLIRIPVVNWAWKHYGVDWVQLDAPRHLHLFTERGFRMMAEQTGYTVKNVVYDSEAFQFHGSEQYRLDIPMNDARTFRGAEPGSIFTQEQLDEWTRGAQELNKLGRGDQACFYLSRRTDLTS